MKYFKGSDWLKDSTKLHFNPDATALADLIPGKVDENSNFIVSDRMDETQLPFTSEERTCIHVRTVTNDPLSALLLKSITVGGGRGAEG